MFSRRKGHVPPGGGGEQAQQRPFVDAYIPDRHDTGDHDGQPQMRRHAGYLGIIAGWDAIRSCADTPRKGTADNFMWIAVSVFVCLSFGASLEESTALGYHHGVAGGFAHAALYVPPDSMTLRGTVVCLFSARSSNSVPLT